MKVGLFYLLDGIIRGLAIVPGQVVSDGQSLATASRKTNWLKY